MFEVIRNEAFFRRMLLEAVNKFLWSILAVLEFILGLRFVETLISPRAETGLLGFLTPVSRIVLAPFETILGVQASAGSVLQLTSLFAMAAYLVVFWMILNMNGTMLARSPLSYQKTNRSTTAMASLKEPEVLESLKNLETVWSGDEKLAA